MWNYKPLLACFHPTILAKFDTRELNYSAEDNKEIKPGQNQLGFILPEYSVDSCDPLSSFWCSHIWWFFHWIYLIY